MKNTFSMNILFLCYMIYSNMLFVNPLNIKRVENVPSQKYIGKYEDLPKNNLNETNQNRNSTESSSISKNNLDKNFEHIYNFVDKLISLPNDKQLERNLKLVKNQKLFKEACDQIQKGMSQYVKNEDKIVKLPQGMASFLNTQLYRIENATKKVETTEDKFFKEVFEKLNRLSNPTNDTRNNQHDENVGLLIEKKNGNGHNFSQGYLLLQNSSKIENYNDTKLNPSEFMKIDKKLFKFEEVLKKLQNMKNLIQEALLKDILYGDKSTLSYDIHTINSNEQNTTQQNNTAQPNNTSQIIPPPKPGLILI